MGRSSSLKVVPLIPTRTLTPRFLNSSQLPVGRQQQLSDLVNRFDKLIINQPQAAGLVLTWADQILKIFHA